MSFSKTFLVALTLSTFYLFSNPVHTSAATISNIRNAPASVGRYEKYQVDFDVATTAQYPMFEYATNPPPGVKPGSGITVVGEITTPSGNRITHPAFYQTRANQIGSGESMRFELTNQTYWSLRYAPQEIGTHQVTIRATDSAGTTSISAGSFTAVSSSNPGFIRVSRSDPRYFEFSNGNIYWPLGPAWMDNAGKTTRPGAANMNYSQYSGTAVNFDRPWMAGWGAFSANWARWASSSEKWGNEGIATRFDTQNVFPGSEITYPLWYNGNPNSNPADTSLQNGFRFWISGMTGGTGHPQLKANTCYQVKLTYRTNNITGPRVSGQPYGLTIKRYGFLSHEETPNNVDNTLRSAPQLMSHVSGTNNWTTYNGVHRTTGNTDSDFNIYLDNVTGGQAYIDEFSLREILNTSGSSTCPSSSTNLGGELIRNSKADFHTYVDQTAAAFFDWQVEEAKRGGVYLKYVAQDKNDPLINRLLSNGNFTSNWDSEGSGYYQNFNTKAGWLRKQWYRYIVARWGYSTSIHSLELNNEGSPDEPNHYNATQEFAKYVSDTDAHKHMVSTSFWCCWRPNFWSSTQYPNVAHADLHDYSGNSETSGMNYVNDVAEGMARISTRVAADRIGKPMIIGEQGLTDNDQYWTSSTLSGLNTTNTGIWYRHIVWSGLGPGAVMSPNYWFTEHMRHINREQIATNFYNFISNLDINKGGYSDIAASVSNNQLRVVGQKNTQTGLAFFWLQNRAYNWNNTNPTAQSGTVTVANLRPSTSYTITRYDTSSGATSNQNVTTSGSGQIQISVNALSGDTAYQLRPAGYVSPTSLPTPTQSQQPSTAPTAQPSNTTRPNPTNTSAPSPTSTPGYGDGDVNQDGRINTSDLRQILGSWSLNTNSNIDQVRDGTINGLDFAYVANLVETNNPTTPIPNPTNTPRPTNTPSPQSTATPRPNPTNTPNPTPTLPPSGPTPTPAPYVSGEWSQHGHNAQRTSYTDQQINTPWRWLWSWNGPSSSGGISSGKSSLPRNVQPVTGAGRVYISAGSRGIFALDENTGNQVWNANPGGNMNSTAAYDPNTNSVFAYSSNGTLYKLNASNGSIAGQFNTGSSSNLPLPPAVISGRVFVSSGNQVFAVNSANMQQIWSYNAGSAVHTPPSYSTSRNLVVVASSDINVHGINNANGSRSWRTRIASDGAFAEVSEGWPVIAEINGLVLVKVRRNWDTLWTWSPWPTSNEQIRANLTNQPDQQALYALNLDSGSIPFIANIGHGGYGDGDYMPMGPQPAVKRLSNGQEVAYTVVRGKTNTDGRWDSSFGELLLNNNTVPGYSAGYIRFISDPDNPPVVTDEQPNVSVMGDYVFGGHWMIGYALRITDRSNSRGSFSSPIQTTTAPYIVSSASNVPFSSSHYSSGRLTNDGDPRDIPSGFYIYYNQPRTYDRYWSEYAVYTASKNNIYHRSNDGAIIAFTSGNPTADNAQITEPVVAGDSTTNTDSPTQQISPLQAGYFSNNQISTNMFVSYVINNGKEIILATQYPHQGAFKAIIKKSVYDTLPLTLRKQLLKDNLITVSGKITWYQGDPVVYINSPRQIEIK